MELKRFAGMMFPGKQPELTVAVQDPVASGSLSRIDFPVGVQDLREVAAAFQIRGDHTEAAGAGDAAEALPTARKNVLSWPL